MNNSGHINLFMNSNVVFWCNLRLNMSFYDFSNNGFIFSYIYYRFMYNDSGFFDNNSPVLTFRFLQFHWNCFNNCVVHYLSLNKLRFNFESLSVNYIYLSNISCSLLDYYFINNGLILMNCNRSCNMNFCLIVQDSRPLDHSFMNSLVSDCNYFFGFLCYNSNFSWFINFNLLINFLYRSCYRFDSLSYNCFNDGKVLGFSDHSFNSRSCHIYYFRYN